MTYRIANVRFNRSHEQSYPVNCDRADIVAGDEVVVEMPGLAQTFKIALVDSVEFKNWNCKNSIVCRRAEIRHGQNGSWSVDRTYLNNGQIHTLADLQARLRAAGWRPDIPRQSTWKVVYTLSAGGNAAEILFRKNGIDFRLAGKLVSHWFFESGIDLYEFCWSFAERWRTQAGDYAEFFQQKGSRFPKPHMQNDLHDIYMAISGGGGSRAYLGDGVWIGRGGNSWDEHR